MKEGERLPQETIDVLKLAFDSKLSPQVREFMASHFKPKNTDAVQMRIDSLSPPVRSYMAVEEVLKNPTLTEDDKKFLEEQQKDRLELMDIRQRLELLTHRKWIHDKL
jgi:hypothetical protein